MAVQFILFNFANYSPSIAMELTVSKEIHPAVHIYNFRIFIISDHHPFMGLYRNPGEST